VAFNAFTLSINTNPQAVKSFCLSADPRPFGVGNQNYTQETPVRQRASKKGIIVVFMRLNC
jgi:hypothetical protein